MVITRSGANTKPEPSIRREHELASPTTLTVEAAAWRTVASRPTALSGAETGTLRSCERSLKTCGKPVPVNSSSSQVPSERWVEIK